MTFDTWIWTWWITYPHWIYMINILVFHHTVRICYKNLISLHCLLMMTLFGTWRPTGCRLSESCHILERHETGDCWAAAFRWLHLCLQEGLSSTAGYEEPYQEDFKWRREGKKSCITSLWYVFRTDKTRRERVISPSSSSPKQYIVVWRVITGYASLTSRLVVVFFPSPYV